MKRSRVTLSIAACTALLLLPGLARGQGAVGPPLPPLPPLGPVAVSGTTPRGWTFTGTLALDGFRLQGGDLVAVGRLEGALLDGRGARKGAVAAAPVEVPVYEIQGTCEGVRLELRATDLEVRGRRVRLGRTVIDLAAAADPGGALRGPLCELARRLGDPVGPHDQVPALLNLTFGLLGGAGPAAPGEMSAR